MGRVLVVCNDDFDRTANVVMVACKTTTPYKLIDNQIDGKAMLAS